MEPFYQDDAVTIYHGDCREIVPQLGKFDLLLTDPPYGIGNFVAGGGNSLSKDECVEINKWDKAPSEETLKMCLESSKLAIVWGGNYLCGALGNCRAPLIWNKGLRGMHFADEEMAWTNFDFGTLRILDLHLQNSETFKQRQHPTQKPIEVMRWCIARAGNVQTILDPFSGSGTTGRAAKDLGKKCVMIEREEKYCEIAARRMAQEVLSL